MKYLVTGGAGFIGSHVVDMIGDSDSVLIVDNFTTGRIFNIQESLTRANVDLVHNDIRDKRLMNATFHSFKPDVVIHLAAQAAITTAENNPIVDLDINAKGTLNLLRIAEESQVKRFIYASTSAVYAHNPSGLATKEDHRLAPENFYGISKLSGEMYTRIAKIPTTILRFGNVYGQRQVPIGDNQVIPKMIRHLLFGNEFFIFDDGKQQRDFIFVEDLVRAIRLSVTGTPGVYNISSGLTYSVNMIASLVAKQLKKDDYEWKYKPERRDQRRINWLDISEAKTGLKWYPLSRLERGLKETIAWWREIGA